VPLNSPHWKKGASLSTQWLKVGRVQMHGLKKVSASPQSFTQPNFCGNTHYGEPRSDYHVPWFFFDFDTM